MIYMKLNPLETGRENLDRWPEDIEDIGFWGRVAYFQDSDVDPYGDDVDLYDHVRYESAGGQNVFERQSSHLLEGLEELGIEEGDTVLEVGASTSMFSELLNEKGYDAYSADLERQGQEIAREKGRSNGQFQADITHLGFQDDSFDYVVAPRVMHLVDDPDMVEEIDRVADEGFVFDYFRSWSAKGVQKHLMNAMDSHTHTDEYIRGIVEKTTGKAPSMEQGFPLPYAVEIPLADEGLAEKIDFIQERYSDMSFTPNTVGYISSEASDR